MRNVEELAYNWLAQALEDISGKVNEFCRETNGTPKDIAGILNIPIEELRGVLNKTSSNMSLLTFAKLLIATGHALDIKPLREAPMAPHDAFNHMPPPPPMPRRNVFSEPHTTREIPSFARPPKPQTCDFEDEFEDELDDDLLELETITPPRPQRREMRETPQPRHFVRREPSPYPQPSAPTPPRGRVSPFEDKSATELIGIIRERLWDSEIDLTRASKSDLVKFLDNKDKLMREYRHNRELEQDPKINEFKEGLKKTIEENPQLKEWIHNFAKSFE